VGEAAQAGTAVKRGCGLARVGRAGYYRHRRPSQTRAESMELRDQIQKIALEFPAYGYRRITRELWRHGQQVNHKRVLRLMRADNLLCLRRRRFVRTTDSAHRWPVYANLAARLVPTGINQLWVADITYVRLACEFVYLAVVLDVFSRRVAGWALARTLEAQLTVAALRMALRQRQPAPGLVHHSDRGVQYACAEYAALLAEHGLVGSMSRRGNPYDNAYAESFMKTLKCEEVYRNEYRSLEEAAASIGEFIEQVYNQQRLHSALDYRPPAEFEETAAA
jgi:putative transposase